MPPTMDRKKKKDIKTKTEFQDYYTFPSMAAYKKNS
jgi:hypothetical protein